MLLLSAYLSEGARRDVEQSTHTKKKLWYVLSPPYLGIAEFNLLPRHLRLIYGKVLFCLFECGSGEARSVPCAPAAFLQVTVKGAKGSSRKPSGAAPDRVPWSMGPRTSGSCFLRPDSCRPPWEAHTYRRVDLQGALDLLHWRASVSPWVPHHRLRSHRPPTRRSTKSYFGPASLLPPHSGNEKMQTILFPEEGSAFLKRRKLPLGLPVPVHLRLWGARLLPWGVCISA